jgi:hypothetical protein
MVKTAGLNSDMRLHKCKACGTLYVKTRPLQSVCSIPCSLKVAREKTQKTIKEKDRQDKKAMREKLEKLKTRKEWADEAQVVVNKYVRLRDAHLGCVSCDKPASWDGQWHASHFRSRGAASAIRFNLWNIHKSCSICNHWKSGNLSEFEPRLRGKIGNEKVDWLRTQNQQADFSIEYLKRLKKVFSEKIKRLEKRR